MVREGIESNPYDSESSDRSKKKAERNQSLRKRDREREKQADSEPWKAPRLALLLLIMSFTAF